MLMLIIGLIIWSAAHLNKRLMSGIRGNLEARIGNGAKGLMALLILISVVLMVIGYRGADVIQLYSLGSWAGYLNNLLMLVAFMLFGVGSTGSWLGSRMRHPMLTGMKIWAVAHLLVNGDVASLLLFGGLLAWAVVNVIAINKTAEPWTPDRTVKFGPRDIVLIIVWLALYGLAAAIHVWLGHNPFLGAY